MLLRFSAPLKMKRVPQEPKAPQIKDARARLPLSHLLQNESRASRTGQVPTPARSAYRGFCRLLVTEIYSPHHAPPPSGLPYACCIGDTIFSSKFMLRGRQGCNQAAAPGGRAAAGTEWGSWQRHISLHRPGVFSALKVEEKQPSNRKLGRTES